VAGGVGGTREEAGGVEKRAQAAECDADHYRRGDAGPRDSGRGQGGGQGPGRSHRCRSEISTGGGDEDGAVCAAW
jgi:hypothetical protein